MNDSTKNFLERTAYVIFFLVAVLVVRGYKENRKPPVTPVSVSTTNVERAAKQEELRKRLAEFDAKEAAGHASRVKRLGEAGAKAQEARCDEELMKVFETAAADKKITPSDAPDCDE